MPSKIIAVVWLILLLVIGFGCYSSQANSTGPVYKTTLGVAGLFPWNPDWKKSLATAKALGFTHARMDFLWQRIEKTQGDYQFGFYDQVYSEMQSKGLTPVFILAYNNPIYAVSSGNRGQQSGITSSTNLAAYTRFVQASAAHFKNKKVIWEVWNEPDSPNFWNPSPNPEAYAVLTQSAIQAIRKADTKAYVSTGGFAHAHWNRKFIQNAMALGMLNDYNALAIHGYDYLNPKLKIEDQEPDHRMLRQWMKQYNAGKVLPIIDTEFGAKPSIQKSVTRNSEDYAAKQTIRMLLNNYYDGVSLSMVYGIDATDELHLSPTNPVGKALQFTNRLLADFKGSPLKYGASQRGITFYHPQNGKKIIAWWSTQGKQTVRFQKPLNITAVYNVYGEKKQAPKLLQKITTSHLDGPLFILYNN